MKAVFCDMYNFTITGDISSNLNAASCDSPTHSGPSLLILNDQGGDVMNISDGITSTLRAQDHGHPPVVCFNECNDRAYISETTAATVRAECHGAIPVVCLNFQGSKSNNVCTEDGTCYSLTVMHGHDAHVVCFEPGILRRDCSAGNRAYIDICSTLRAQMGDNQPAVCYAIDHVVTTGGNCTAQGPCWYENICPTEKASGVHAVCFQNTGQGWWNQEDIAQTLRTPCGGDSIKANLVLESENDCNG